LEKNKKKEGTKREVTTVVKREVQISFQVRFDLLGCGHGKELVPNAFEQLLFLRGRVILHVLVHDVSSVDLRQRVHKAAGNNTPHTMTRRTFR